MPLAGAVQLDAWGNQYCARHANEYPRCSCCQRLICERLTGGGVAYSDGRLVCNVCRKTAIDTEAQAKPYIEAMAAWLYQQGFQFQNLALRVKLVGQQELAASGPRHGSGETQGMIFRATVTGGGRSPQRRVEGVAILKGLSRQVLEGVALHELGHAWLFLHSVDGLGQPVEEGFCNTLSYLYHATVNSDEARFCRVVIEHSPDPVYGDGFRSVYAAVRRHGLMPVTEYLQRYRRLPS